jgi:hypothetical protein
MKQKVLHIYGLRILKKVFVHKYSFHVFRNSCKPDLELMNLLVQKLNPKLPILDILTKLALTSQKKFK